MFAVSLETAKTAAIVIIIAFVVMGILSAWLIKTVVTKLILIVVLAGLAIGVYSQRASLQDCADKAKSNLGNEVTCTFFGTDVKVPAVERP
jgi:high-affinity Fe2+/Pb2+ permease